jgi:hypothetical protein
MSAREDARDWDIANCLICGRPFGQEEAWMDNCPVCFKEQKGYKLLKGDLAFACLQYEIERLRSLKVNPPPTEEDGDTERLRLEIEALSGELMRRTDELDKSERKRQRMRLKVRELEGEVERVRREGSRSAPGEASLPLDLALLRKMLLLCHPDTNPNNVAPATEVTQWLLAQKAKLKP